MDTYTWIRLCVYEDTWIRLYIYIYIYVYTYEDTWIHLCVHKRMTHSKHIMRTCAHEHLLLSISCRNLCNQHNLEDYMLACS